MIDVDAFARSGYWVARGLLNPGALDAALDDLRTIFNAQARVLGVAEVASIASGDLAALLEGVFEADASSYRAAGKLVQWSIALQRLAACDEFVRVAHALGLELPVLATRPVLHIMGNRLRIPGSYQTSPAHQDWRAVQGSLDQLNLWAPFHDIDEQHYALQIVPGSHLLGLLESESDPFGHRVAGGQIADDRFVTVPMRKGDVVFFSGFLVHRTGPAGPSRAVRLSASFRFNNAAEAQFVRRGYPIPYFQTDMTLLADPPSRETVAAFYARTPLASATASNAQ